MKSPVLAPPDGIDVKDTRCIGATVEGAFGPRSSGIDDGVIDEGAGRGVAHGDGHTLAETGAPWPKHLDGEPWT